MARREQVQTRVGADTKNAIEEYCEENDVSQAEALRRAADEKYRPDLNDTPTIVERLAADWVVPAASLMVFLGIFALIQVPGLVTDGQTLLAMIIYGSAMISMVVGAAITAAALAAQLATERPLAGLIPLRDGVADE